ncbi:unnamed protein product [Cunninghamella echinulata]
MATNHSILNHIISCYLINEAEVHNHLPFILDSLITRTLLNDLDTSEEMSIARRKWTVRLNALIQSKYPSTRWSTIILIKKTCEQSPNTLFTHIRSWTNQLLGLISKPENPVVHKIAIETLSYIFTYTSNKPELQREITIPNLSRFCNTLFTLGQTEELLPTVLLILKNTIIHFPSQSRHIADPCIKLILNCIDGSSSFNSSVVLAAGHCLSALHRIPGKTSSSDQWKTIILNLIGSVHICLNQLFNTVDEEYEISDITTVYPFVNFSPDYVVSFPMILRRIQSLIECITICLGSQTLSLVSVPIAQIVELLCRIYNVFDGSLMREFKDKKEFTALMTSLPTLHYNANKLLSSFLFSSGRHLLKYDDLFSRILIRLLNEYETQRFIKVSIYNNITLCLQYFGYTFGEKLCKPLISSILKDIQLTSQKVTDSAPNQTKDSSKKRKRNGLTNSDVLTTSSTITAASSYDIQMAALDALNSLISCFGSSMDLYSRNLVDSNVISRILYATQTSLDLTLEEEQLIKEKLYNCLLVSIMNPIEVQASILPHAIRIFSAGLNEQNHKLQMICKHGLDICDLIIHPRMPPTQTTTNTIMSKLSQVSQYNVINPVDSDMDDYSNIKVTENKTTIEKEGSNNISVAETMKTSTGLLENTMGLSTNANTNITIEESNNNNKINEPKTASLSSIPLEHTATITTSSKHFETTDVPILLSETVEKSKIETDKSTITLEYLNEKETTTAQKSTQLFTFDDDDEDTAIEQDMDNSIAQIDTDIITNSQRKRQSKSQIQQKPDIIHLSDDDDDDFEMPGIDMAGPDSDDEFL